MIFASTPATGSALHKGPGVYLAAGVGWGRVHGPNPVLVEFRKYVPLADGYTSATLAAHWTQSDFMWSEMVLDDAVFTADVPLGSPEQEAHAYRVLTRLARIGASGERS